MWEDDPIPTHTYTELSFFCSNEKLLDEAELRGRETMGWGSAWREDQRLWLRSEARFHGVLSFNLQLPKERGNE